MLTAVGERSNVKRVGSLHATTIYVFVSNKSFVTMRPAIDISYALHGRVKDYAEETDLSLDQAYIEVLKTGLNALETRE